MRFLPLLAALTSPAAHAAEWSLDVILVAPTDAADPELAAEAEAIDQAIRTAMGTDRLVVALDDVPRFGRDADLDALTYLRSCPEGRYTDCAWVVAQRGQADVAVAPRLTRTADGTVFEVAFLDVEGAVVRLDLPIDHQTEGVGARVVGMLDAMLDGQMTLSDVRVAADDAVDPDAASTDARRAAQAEMAELAADAVDRGDREEGRRARLRRADLDRWRGADVPPPWEGLGLPADSWRRWRNSGKSLPWWRAKAQGRQGELMVSVSLITLASGPWATRHEVWYSIDPVSLEREDTLVVQDQEKGLLRSWEFALGGGPLPWMDLTVYGGPRITTWQYRVQRIVPGEDDPIDPLADRPVTTWHVGGRVTVAPFPTLPARPTFAVGAEAWWSEDRTRVLEVPEGIPSLPRNQMVLMVTQLGGEVDIGPVLRAWARVDLGIPVSARVAQVFESGGTNLPEDRPTVDASNDGISIGGSVGLTARIRVAGHRWKRVSSR